MAYDSEVKISTALDNAGIEHGVKDAEKKVKRLENAFDKANIAVKKQEALVSSLAKQYEEVAAKADKIGQEFGLDSREFERAAREADAMQKNLQKNTRELENAKAKADVFADAIEKASAEYKELSDKKVELEVEGVQNAKPPEMIPETESASLLNYAEQVKQTKEDIQGFTDVLMRLNEQLSTETDPKNVRALKHEIAMTEKAFEKFKSSISAPVADIMKIEQVEKELEAARRNLGLLADEYLKSETTFARKLVLDDKMRAARKEVAILEKELQSLTFGEIDTKTIQQVAGKIKDVGVAAEKTAKLSSGAFKRVASVISSIGNAAMFAARTTVNAFKRIISTVSMIAVGAVKAVRGISRMARSILHLGRQSGRSADRVDFLGRRIMRLAASVFVFDVLRKALDGLTKDLGAVLLANEQFSRSWNAVQVNLLTAFAPLWEVIEPAILSFMDLLARFTSVLAQFMATLFGRTYQQAKDAAKGIYDVANATEDVGKAAKKSLAPFDELIIAASELGGAETGEAGLDFEAVETPDPADFAWLDTLKEKLDGIFDVFKQAWEKSGQPLVDAFNRAVSEIIGLFGDIANAFYNIWTGGTGLAFLTSFFDLLTTILNIIGDISEAFRAAWTTDGRGEALIESFFALLTSINNLLIAIGESFRKAWTTDGAGEALIASFLELLTAWLNLLRDISEAFRNAWNDDGAGVAVITAFLEMLTAINDLLISIIESFRKAWNENERGQRLISAILGLLENIFGLVTDIAEAFKTAFDNKGERLFASILDLLKEILLIIDDIITAFRTAWDENDRGVKLAESLLDMFSQINELLISIAQSFREAWNDSTGEKIMANILEISTNINNTIGTIAEKIKEAWKANDNGVAIWETILGIINDILETVNEMSFATLEWAKELNLEPLITAFKDLLEAMQPFVNLALDGLQFVHEEILLPMSKWASETAIPEILDLITEAFKSLDKAIDAFKSGANFIFDEFLTPIAKWTGGTFVKVIDEIKEAVKSLGDMFADQKENIDLILKALGTILSTWWEFAKIGFELTVDKIINTFKLLAGQLEAYVTMILEVLGGIIKFVKGVFAGDWNLAWEGIKQIFKGVINGVLGILENGVNFIISGINSMIRAIVDKINVLISAANVVAGIVGQSFNSITAPQIPTLTIPRLKTGLEYVPTDFYGPVYLDKGERVLTAAENREYTGGEVLRIPTTRTPIEYSNALTNQETENLRDNIFDTVVETNAPIVVAMSEAVRQIVSAIERNKTDFYIGDEKIHAANKRYESQYNRMVGVPNGQ